MVVIIDYNMGNFAAIQNMIKRLGHESLVSNNPDDLDVADKIILPGVGSFDYGMENLEKTGFFAKLKKRVLEDKIPLLGICLGMQLLLDSSEEGTRTGLSFIKGKVVKFKENENLKIPHMGWNEIEIKKSGTLLDTNFNNQRFYFVHSFYSIPKSENDIIAYSNHGTKFVCAMQKDNITGLQFHPEKSHKYGLAVLDNFIKGAEYG